MAVSLKANGARVTWLELFGGLVGIAIALPVRGWVGSLLWRWYAVPLGLPTISIPQWIGIVLIISLLPSAYLKEARPMSKVLGDSIGVSLTAALIGWIAHLFIA